MSLPSLGSVPLPSPHLAHAVGHAQTASALDAPAENGLKLEKFGAPSLLVQPADVPGALDAIEDAAARNELGGSTEDRPGSHSADSSGEIATGESLRFLAAASRFVRHLLAQHRMVPMIQQDQSGAIAGVWQPWLGDEQTAKGVSRLMAARPAVSRCAEDTFNHDGWSMLDEFLLRTGDALCRKVLVRDAMQEAIDGRDPAADLHVAWLAGLLGSGQEIDARPGPRNDLIKGVRRWIGGLEERGSGAAWRLLLRISEPLDLKGLDDFQTPGDKVRWAVSLHLQNVVEPGVVADAADIWLLPPGAASVEGQRIEQPQELLLSELGRGRAPLEAAGKGARAGRTNRAGAYHARGVQASCEIKPLLVEQGFGVVSPDWWDSPTVRLGARMLVQSDDVDLNTIERRRGATGATGSTTPQLGLASLVSYRWQIAVGDTNLTLEQFEKLAAQHSPLIRLNGRWVEIRPEDVKAAIKFIRENPGGKMEVGRALRLAYASDVRDTGVPVLGMDATGWVAAVFGDAGANTKMPMIEAPQGFVGTLRAYQLKGLSWLAFLDKLGLGLPGRRHGPGQDHPVARAARA